MLKKMLKKYQLFTRLPFAEIESFAMENLCFTLELQTLAQILTLWGIF
jgi:hypothetical protein